MKTFLVNLSSAIVLTVVLAMGCSWWKRGSPFYYFDEGYLQDPPLIEIAFLSALPFSLVFVYIVRGMFKRRQD